jgi:hypothetical protein
MKPKGTKSIVENNYNQATAPVVAISGLPPGRVGLVPKAVQVPRWMIWVQYVPLVGWMFSHFPGEIQLIHAVRMKAHELIGLYFESIEAMQAGEMTWKGKKRMD